MAEPPAPPNEFANAPLLRGEIAFRLLVDAVQDYAIFLLAPDGGVLTWNRGAQRIKGYTADEIIGRHFSVFYTAEDRASGRPNRLLSWAAEYGRFEDEGWRVRKDGERFWADVIVTALRGEDGAPYAYAKVTRDLTERRAAEEQRRALLVEQQARAAAEEALSTRDRFLSIAAHELKTPVASLQLSAESLIRSRTTGRLDDERLDAGLRRMTKATDRLGVLVHELLDVSRLTSDSQALELRPVDLVPLVREVVDRFADAAGAERIHLTTPTEAWVEADEARLDQVVTNLVDNALKYSAEADPIDVELREAGDGIELRVSDRGIGLDEETVGRIFEAFGRGANAEHYQGLGLGLFISQQIVERHGGRIGAGSRADGEGSVFTVWLRRAAT